jgi:D-glycero-alpha-D-manno-heptose-7-phosphate kinase
VGGGSDLPSFYKHSYGAVVCTSINKYVYVTINEKFDNRIRVGYSKNEEVSSVEEIDHKIVKAGLQLLEIQGGIELTTVADVPSHGTGLGSSSSFTVGLINALQAYKGLYSSKDALGSLSCKVEIELCNQPIGKQDQYAAAYGGFNYIRFLPDDTVTVTPILCDKSTVDRLQRSLLLLYTNINRSASKILREQSLEMKKKSAGWDIQKKMVDLADQMKIDLEQNEGLNFGTLLNENWDLKKSINDQISNPKIDQWYNTARKNGAEAGKILGAGAGGFLLFFAPQERHDTICASLPELKRVPFSFESQGSQIVFAD